MTDFVADSTLTNRYGHTGLFAAGNPRDSHRPGELRVGVLDYPEHGGNLHASTHISYDEAERLRDWLNNWLIENWPQEDNE